MHLCEVCMREFAQVHALPCLHQVCKHCMLTTHLSYTLCPVTSLCDRSVLIRDDETPYQAFVRTTRELEALGDASTEGRETTEQLRIRLRLDRLRQLGVGDFLILFHHFDDNATY